ncbi:MAG: ABC transporter ATP-binding protein [Acidimicrobiia bacterium]|nr:ABC transporter ATP-binding protein [Acidimicrobiia bacterium]MXZ85373.1 ABC transporter ATP-binding protein [Acidimicrobiia bacterium]MYE73067.1 ABC transporter ATP-binding protein [Acidimicrobiia bacterium]MYG73066.1 ABC transporter ATP-binding protein [Acidimicrobiia bacterium]MYH95554.1 ABC transporter ATP-binding protein [Acidimicrobiia bacterium]
MTGAGGSDPSVPAVELVGITKRFGGIIACDQVDLTLHRGRIHGILGENGAGKSTLMKVLIGLVLPDAGSVRIDGQPRTIHDPLAAAALGIAMVHQHFSLVDQLSVWENVALGEEGRLKSGGVRDRVAAISQQYGLEIDPDARVGELTAGLRQRVEIIKCLRRDPHILVFDEPTSVLTPEESEQLFGTLREVVAAEGRAVVLVSHKLDEVLHATDEITIMRQGRVVDHRPTQEADARSLARAMVGREVSLRSERAAFGLADIEEAEEANQEAEVGFRADIDKATDVDAEDWQPAGVTKSDEPVMRIEGVSVRGRGGARLLDDISLDLRAGEIVGVAGVEGNGQRTLGDLLSSLVRLNTGRVVVNDKEVPTGSPGAMAKAGVAVIPEDRHDSGVVLDMTVAENLLMVDPHRVARHGVMDKAQTTELAQKMIEEFDIGCSGPDAPLWSLSGGNQQRVVLARELAAEPDVLIAAQPTRGLDVGAIEYMTDRLRQTAIDGVAVLLISSELEEILDLADRIVVMSRGRIVGELSHDDANLETLGLLMGGSEA